MAYNTRQLRREGKPPSGQLASPVPQYWNPTIEDFEDVIGNHGAPYAMLVGPNGQPISSSNALPVSDSAVAQALAQLATEGKLEQVRVLLEALASKAATETTLAQVLAKLSNDPATAANQQAAKAILDALASKDFATQATLAQVLARLEAIEEQLDTGNAKVQLKGSTVDMATETTLAQSVDKLNSILSRLEGKLDTAIFDSQGNPISAANRLPVEATLSGQVPLDPVSAGVVVAGTELQRLPGRQRGTVMIRGANNDMPGGNVYLIVTRSPLRVVDLNIWASTGQVTAYIYTRDAFGNRLRYEVALRNSDTGDYSWSDAHRFHDIAGSTSSNVIHSPVFDAEGEEWNKPHRFFLRPERAPLDLPGGLELRVFRNSGGYKLAWSIEIAEGVI